MFRNYFMNGLNSSLPFSVPSTINTMSNISNTSKLLKGTSKLSFTGILDNASKTINTINQIVPLYQQIRPMFNNAKTALNIFKNVKNIDNIPTSTNINTPKPKEENQIKTTVKEKKQEESSIMINNITPNKPFFV